MGIKFSDAAHLAAQNVVSYKLRSLAIVLTVSIIFGLIIGINFLFTGLRTTLLDASTIKTVGASYVVARFKNTAGYNSREERLAERAKQHHGEKVGSITDYQIAGMPNSTVASYDLFQPYIDQAKLASLPSDRLPVLLIPDASRFSDADNYKEIFATDYYAVGELPTTPTIGDSSLPGELNLLNLSIKQSSRYPVWYSYGFGVILDNGDGRVQNYIQSKLDQAEDQSAYNSIKDYDVIRFDNYKDLTGFIDASDAEEHRLGRPTTLEISSIFSDTASIAQGFFDTDRALFVIETVLMIVAVIITTFTFIHLLDQESPSVALYRSLGATTGDILLIYLIYLLELCLISVFTSIIIGLVIVAVISGANVSALTETLQDTYELSSVPHVFLLGIDHRFFATIFCVLLTAPLALLLSQGRLSSKHLASSIKDDQY